MNVFNHVVLRVVLSDQATAKSIHVMLAELVAHAQLTLSDFGSLTRVTEDGCESVVAISKGVMSVIKARALEKWADRELLPLFEDHQHFVRMSLIDFDGMEKSGDTAGWVHDSRRRSLIVRFVEK